MKMSHAIKIVALVLSCIVLASCVSVGEHESGNLPWNAPASWENSTIGIRH